MAITLQQTRVYKDVSFTMDKHPLSNELLTRKDAESIRQAVKNLLLLRRGDKPFHPEIYSPIYDFLFENIAGPEIFVLRGEIENILAQYEPRFVVDDLTADFPTPNNINLNLVGHIVNTTSPLTINVLLDRYR